jgi:hypothetical protein
LECGGILEIELALGEQFVILGKRDFRIPLKLF